MSRISADLDKAIESFQTDSKGKVSPEMLSNLRACIESSPELAERMNLAVEKKFVTGFAPQPAGAGAGAQYRKGVIEIPLESLVSRPDKPFDIEDMAFVLGHETQHGFNAAERNKATMVAALEVRRIAKSRTDDNHDDPTEVWQQAARVDEAKSSLAGWNAAVSQHRQSGGEMTLEAMYKAYPGRANTFVDQIKDQQGRVTGYERKDGITLSDDLSVDVNDPANIEALGKYYYDDPTRQVGPAKAGYANYTGASILNHIIAEERKYGSDRMTLDFARFGMSEEAVERNGLSLGKHAKDAPFHVVIDTSSGMAVERRLHHTKDDTVSADWVNQHVPVAPARKRLIGGFDDPNHLEHDLYKELAERLPPGTSPDRLAQITLAASRGGIQAGELRRMDVTDTGVYLAGAIPGDRAMVDLTAAPPPKAESEQQHAKDAEQRQMAMQQQWQQMEQQQVMQQGGGLSR